MKDPEVVLFGDNYYQCVIYLLGAYIADYGEQVLLSCIVHNWCVKCLTYRDSLDEDALQCVREHTNLLVKEFDACKLWEKYGIAANIIVCSNVILHF